MNSLFRDYEIIVRSGLFDPAHYLALYPDVAHRNVDPLIHYLEEGAQAARSPHPDFDAEFYLAQCRRHGHRPENPLLHYLTVGAGLGFKTKPHAIVAAEAANDGQARPRERTESPAFGRPPMQLYVDEVSVGRDGVLRIAGWVVCLAPVAAVEVLLDGEPLGPAEYGRLRPDVAEIRADYPDARRSGFLFLGEVRRFGAGPRMVVVRATAQSGISREAVQTLDIAELSEAEPTAEQAIRCHCDRVVLTTTGHLSLSGWAVARAPTIAIEVLIDDELADTAQVGGERGDVGNLFPLLPHARHAGFALDHDARASFAGEHKVTLRIRQSDDHVDEVILPVLAVQRAADPEVTPAVAAVSDRELTLDTPVLVGGVMETPVRGNLEISGWALARTGVAAIEIAVDDQVLMAADYGLRRLDVLSAFPDWDDSLESGFLALVPQRMLPRGLRKITVTLRDKAGGTTNLEFRLVVEPPSADAGPGALRRRMPAAEVDLGRRLLAARDWHPTFEVLVVIDAHVHLNDIRLTVASLQSQVYEHWRLELVWEHGRGVDDLTHEQLAGEFAALGEQCRLVRSPAEVTVDEAAFVAVLSPGSELGCDALHEMALAMASHREADFFYSDERRQNPATSEMEAFFKPQWSPDLLLSTNYVGQFWCARGDLVRRVVTAGGLPLMEPYDLVLRLTEAAQAIRHVPLVLCERAAVQCDRSEQEMRALDSAAARRGIPAEVQSGLVPGTYRFRHRLAGNGMVSIIIPTRAAEGMVARCIETTRARTTYDNFEIVCVENIPPADVHWRGWLETQADQVLSGGETFNWSRFNNQAVAAARGEYLLFLNDDIEIVDPDWLGVLVEQAQRPEVGIVGPMLLYPDQRIQHAGMFLAAMAQARHAFRYGKADDPGYFGLALTERNVIAVTGACLMTRRDVFTSLGGFDEAHDIVNNDLDYCLRVWQAELATIYTPHTRLIHHEAVSRAGMEDAFDVVAFGKWSDLFLRGDPFFSPHLAKTQDTVTHDDEPNRLVVTGGPVLRRDEIKKVLVVKVDHLGDCIMAFPAIRSLQAHFPNSRITVLTLARGAPGLGDGADGCGDDRVRFLSYAFQPRTARLVRRRLAPIARAPSAGAIRLGDRSSAAPRNAAGVAAHRRALPRRRRLPGPVSVARYCCRMDRRSGFRAQAATCRRRSDRPGRYRCRSV